MILVCTVVGDVQLAVSVNEGQVTIAIQTTRMSGTNGNQVAVVDIMDSSGGITEYSLGIGIHITTTTGDITSRKDGVMDVNASFLLYGAHVYVVPSRWPVVSALGFQRIQVIGGYIVANLVGLAIIFNRSVLYLQPGLYQHLAVLGELALGSVFLLTRCFPIGVITFFSSSNFFGSISTVFNLYCSKGTVFILEIIALIIVLRIGL